MPESLKTIQILISGRVQGVGFRYFTESLADKYPVKGYVKNTSDNRVEVICQGESDDIDQFLKELKKGPAFSVITDIGIEELKINKIYNSFSDNIEFSVKYIFLLLLLAIATASLSSLMSKFVPRLLRLNACPPK